MSGEVQLVGYGSGYASGLLMSAQQEGRLDELLRQASLAEHGCVTGLLKELTKHKLPLIRLLAAERLVSKDPEYAHKVLADLSRGVSCDYGHCEGCYKTTPMPIPPFSCTITRKAELELRRLHLQTT